MNPSVQSTSVNKDPWLAVNLSKLLPGLGQLYSRQVSRGIIILAVSLLIGMIGLNAIFSATGSFAVGGSLLLFQFALWIWNMLDSHQCARSLNSIEYEQNRRHNIKPWLAIFWSTFWPGLGHFYLKKPLTGVLLVLLSLALSWIPIIGILWFCLVIYITYRSTSETRAQNSKRIIQFIFIFCVLTLISSLTPFLIRYYIAEARYIPAGSMEPILQVNDRLIINKTDYYFHEPERGDIVVFNPTEALQEQGFKEAFIKRIVGIPGDRIEIKEGGVYVNTQRLTEPYVANGDPTSVEICSFEGIPAFLAKPVTIPKNSFLVLGDNRNNSYDGRCWGLVRKQEIIGKASKIFYPFNRVGAIPSPDFPGISSSAN
jgi:signal peptidase I